MSKEERFMSIRKRYMDATERENVYRTDVLLRRYGKMHPPSTWLTRTEENKLATLNRAQGKAMDAMFSLLDDISPRYWRAGVAAWWVMENLSYADAINAGPLSVIPQAGYGSTTRDAEVFAQAV
jgi:hypothetical protein